jgi:hypothetical protein
VVRSRLTVRWLSILVAVLGAMAWTAMEAASASATTGTTCTVSGTTADVVLDQPASTTTSLFQDGSGNLQVESYSGTAACGGFQGGGALTAIDLSVTAGAPAQTVVLDQTEQGGVFPCSAVVEGSLRGEDTIEVQGAPGEPLTAGDTSGGTGVNLNGCSSVGTITGVGSYELRAGTGLVTLSAGGGLPFAAPLSVPATLKTGSSSNTLIGGAAADTIDFRAVPTSAGQPLMINVSGAPASGVANDSASAGSVTDTFTSGGAQFTTFDGATGGHTDFLAGSGSDTFADPSGAAGDTVDFSGLTTSASTPLTVNLTGASADGVGSDTAVDGSTTDTIATGGAAFNYVAAGTGFTTFLPGASAAGFNANGAATNTIDFSEIPTSFGEPLIVNRSGGTFDGASNDTAVNGAVVYSFSDGGFGTFDASADGNTTFLAGTHADAFGATAGSTSDTLDFLAANGTSLTINASATTSNGVAGDTALLGSATETFSPNISSFAGLPSGNTTFVAGAAGGAAFLGEGTGNTLDLTAAPAAATVTGNGALPANSGAVTSLAAGAGGSTTDTFAGIQSYLSAPNTPTAAVDDATTGSAWGGGESTGASAYDTAAVSAIGAVVPTGSMTYDLFTNGTCAGNASSSRQVTLSNGSVPNSSATGALAPGSYSFQADYSGDASFRPSASACEPFTVSAAPSSPSGTTSTPTTTTPTSTTPTATTPTTTTPTSTTPAPAAASKIAIDTASARVSARGALLVKLSCSRGKAKCTGTLTLTVKKRKIASARFSLAAGHTGTIKLKLTKAGLRSLAAAKHHRMKATVTASTAANKAQRALTLT